MKDHTSTAMEVNDMKIGCIKQAASNALLENGITASEFSFIAHLERMGEWSEEDENKAKQICHKINAWYFNY